MKSLNKWLILIVGVVALIVSAIKIDRELRKRRQIIERSERRVDSLYGVIERDKQVLRDTLAYFSQLKGETIIKIDESKKKEKEIIKDITDYLNASDSVRFARFKSILTQVD